MKKIKTLLIIAILTFISAAVAIAQPGVFDLSFAGDGRTFLDLAGDAEIGRDVALTPDDKIVVAGTTVVNGLTQMLVTRYMRNGDRDLGFGTSGHILPTGAASVNNFATAVAVRPDRKIVLVGYTGNGTQLIVARFNEDGTPDPTFAGGGVSFPVLGPGTIPSDVMLTPDGRILITGVTQQIGDVAELFVGRFSEAGAPDASFGATGFVVLQRAGNQTGKRVMLTANGRVLVAGTTSTFAGLPSDFLLMQLTDNGNLDTTFSVNGTITTDLFSNSDDIVGSAAIQKDGKIVVAGKTKASGGSVFDAAVARFNSSGFLDTGFSGDGKATRNATSSIEVTDLAVEANGRILLGGNFFPASLPQAHILIRFESNGSPSNSFGNGDSISVERMLTDQPSSLNAFISTPDRRIIGVGSAVTGASATILGIAVMYSDSGKPADYDNDSQSDLAIFRPSVGEWWNLNASTGANLAVTFGLATDRLTPGDFDGDGKYDQAFWRPAIGEWFVLRSSNFTYYSAPFGSPGDVPAPGDFDGDWRSDFTIFRPTTGIWYIARSTGGTSIEPWGANGDKPVIADYDGDGKSDIAIFRSSDATWWIKKSSGGTFAATFGAGSDIPVQGDYTGDGKADIACWRPSNGTWFVQRSEDGSFYSAPFGTTGDIPVPGDFDRDRKNDFAIYRPSTSVWYVDRSRYESHLIQQFGAVGDVPVHKAYNP